MRADKRSLLNQPSILQLPCRAIDCRHLLLFFLAHGRQDSRQTPRKHRLSGAGRSNQKQIMGSGSCNHCSSLCFFHSAQQCKVRRFLFFFRPAFCLTLPSVFRVPPHPFLFLRRRVYILHCFFQAANAHDRQFPNRKPFSQIFKRNQIASKSALICRMQPRTCLIRASSPTSPTAQSSFNRSGGTFPCAARMTSAVGKSNDVPDFTIPAGE